MIDPTKIAAALGAPLHACEHIYRGDPVPWSMCALHPGAGVLCVPDCVREHLDAHEPSPFCVSCGELLDFGAEPVDSALVPFSVTLTHASTSETRTAWKPEIRFAGVNQCRRCASLVEPASN